MIDFRQGDCRDVLRSLPDASVHCCVTSPPYFGLRDYGNDSQIGLEPTPDAFVAELVSVFREVRRVLRDDGTLWLNLGDSYANDGKWGGARGGKHASGLHGESGIGRGKKTTGLKPKDRMMIPARVALALQADGWWLRDEIIWHKPNPMPVSVTDRTTPAHEMLYMLTKSARYHYDMKAVKEPAAYTGAPKPGKQAQTAYTGLAVHSGDLGQSKDGKRQPRSVWTVTPKPFKGAHFATFPPDLVRPCILAGCPLGGTVLDPFGGAGTTGLVAVQNARNAILIELNPEYIAIAQRRIYGHKMPWEQPEAKMPWE